MNKQNKQNRCELYMPHCSLVCCCEKSKFAADLDIAIALA